jgi:HAD superfamily hydrolase (TIGR01490 family)
MPIKLAFWDMDHTIIDNDCDVSWKDFLVAEGLAPKGDLALKDKFYQDYLDGCLDFEEFTAFQLREFRDRTPEEMAVIADRHFATHAAHRIYPEAASRIAEQQAAGIPTILLTATNAIIAQPLATRLSLPRVLATELELIAGRYTGAIAGIYCCAEGKVEVLARYANARNCDLADCAYYGDSSNDVPVLETVGHPHAVNPGEKLRKTAEDKGWPILNFQRLG